MGQVLESGTHAGPARLADSWPWHLCNGDVPSPNGLPVDGDHATVNRALRLQ